MALTRLPGSKWWIETDDVTFEIIGTYNKAQITADIQAIQTTLLSYPNLTQEATDVDAVIKRVEATDWTVARKARTIALVQAMYQTYQTDPRQLETAQLTSKLNALIELRARLV